ncbi:MAG: bifunctional folylpolyglutamate synthase/dihydrofolate synthase [Opitutae bacterium]|nr:bifunctional folylpolyglutamate synthase/dihydrofolate synthase [Opitutae bacterium]
MTHAETIAELCSLRNHGSKFGIDRMRGFAAALGSPQQAFPCIHLAGTNGKGSTAAMLEAILRGSGLRVGLYTSPHLVKLGERVQVNRVPLSDAQICDYAAALYDVAKKFGVPGDEDYPSFFEFMTAMAFSHFKRERCDAAVIETGLGGRLDATNILAPKVCVITSIGLDHCEMLGDSIEKIAAEKAGIIKNGVPVVMGVVPEAAENVIRRVARERSAPVISAREKFGADIKNFPETNLRGDHQRRNAAAAKLAAEAFFAATMRNVPAGIDGFLQNVNWAARWDTRVLSDGQTLVIDVAHNAECAVVLGEMLKADFATIKAKPTVVCGVLGIARARPILRTIADFAAKIVLVRPAQDRACTLAELRSCIPADFAGEIEESSVARLFPRANFCSEKPANGGKVIVAGSCYLAGEVLAALSGTPTEPCDLLQDKLR